MRVRTILLLVCASGLAGMLAACGGPSSPTPSPPAASLDTSSPTEGTAAPSSGWDINETPRDQLAEGGEFTGMTTVAITNWNTLTVSGSDVEINFLQAAINPAYYDYDGNGNAILNPDYLVSADPVTRNTDGRDQLVVTLKLNPKAVWNDGEMIGADDWIATWQALNGSNPEFLPASTDGWDQIVSIEAGATQQDVIITFSSTYPDWTSIVSGGPLRAEGVATPAEFNEGWQEYKDEYFTGPFQVTSWDKTSGTVVMEPNPNWWGAKPLLSKLTWRLLAPGALAAAFANQEIDYYDIGPDADGFQQASKALNSVVRRASAPTFRQLTFNSQSPNLVDVNVRQAIVMGLDRMVITQSDLAGLPVEPQLLNNNLFVVGQPGYVDQAAATGIDYDVEQARAKLDAAGWTMNDATGFREKDGKQFDLTFVVMKGVPASENEGLQAQKMLKEIGINLTLKAIDPDRDFGPTLQERSFDIIGFTWAGSPYPLNNIGQIYGGTMDGDSFVPNQFNVAQLEIPTVLELEPLIDVEMDPAKRLELGNQAAQAIWESVHTLPLYQRPLLVGVRDNLANIGAFGMARVAKWENVGLVK